MMPGIDGVEVFKKMKAHPQWKDVPVVFITAKSQHHEQGAYEKLGAAGVIIKPFDPLTLCEELTLMWKGYKSKG